MSLSKEESNFLRFYFLNLTIASKAVRKYFNSVHKPSGLTNALANCSGSLKGLRFITNSQMKILYPNPACNVRSEDFDTTLMVCLLRNMTPHEYAPITGWDNLPLQGDASTGADLARVKWYRNMLAHHKDGKLSPVDFSQYWTDLESAISRLGGPLLLKESQSAQNIVLDTYTIEIFNKLKVWETDIHNLQTSQEKHASIIKDLQTKCENHKSVKEKHETEIQQLHDSLQDGETVAHNLATNLSDTTISIAKSKEEIEACQKEIKTNEVRISVLQEQLVNTQMQIDKLIAQIDKLEFKYEQHDKLLNEHSEHLAQHNRQFTKSYEQMAKQDEEMVKHKEQMEKQILAHVKVIDDIKKKQHITDDTSNESIRKRLEENTKVLIEEDVREGTFVTTKAVKDGLLLLKKNGVLLITGHAGTGKSRISRHILHLYCTEYSLFKGMKLNKLQEWENMVRREDNVVILIDDIFGETNCIYDRETDMPTLDKIHAYVRNEKGNIKVILTIRDTVKRQCQAVFDSHRLFKFDLCDLSSAKYKLSDGEKQDILTKYMNTVQKSECIKCKGFVDHNGVTILSLDEVSKIIMADPVLGFPLVVNQFVQNNHYFQQGSKFFDRPTEAIIEEINEKRRKGETLKEFKIQYGVMVLTVIKEYGFNPNDNSNVTELVEIIDAIYGETITMNQCHIADAVKELKGSYLVKIHNHANQWFYNYHHQTLQESVILSFAQINDKTMNMIIRLLSWTFFLKMVKPNAYNENEGEVVLKIPTNSYKLLAGRIIDIYMQKACPSAIGIEIFLVYVSNSEIFQQKDCVFLAYLIDAVEKTDQEDNYTEKMIRSNNDNSYLLHLKNKDVFLAVLLVMLAMKEGQFETFQFILQKIKSTIRTENNYFTTDYIKSMLITSLYQICLKKDVRSVKQVKALLHIVEENKIPVLLDQNIRLKEIQLNLPSTQSSVCDYSGNVNTCVFLSLCILNAYKQCDIPLLEYLVSRYYDTLFDVNLFLKMCYSDNEWIVQLSSLSHKSLKWMIEKFEDKELIDIDFILETACHCQMIDTVVYLAPKSKRFDAISCLKLCIHMDNSPNYNIRRRYNHDLPRYNKDMFNFLFSKIDNCSTNLISIALLVLQEDDVPDFVFDAFLPVSLNNKEILTMACKNANVYVAKQIIEKSQNVDFQSALSASISIPSDKYRVNFFFAIDKTHLIEERQLEIVKCIIEKFGYDSCDLKAVCQQAYNCKKKNVKIIEWCVMNTDLSLLDVDFIRTSTLEEGGFDLLEYTLKKIKLSSFEKMKILKSITKCYTTECSTQILEIVSTVWNSTDDKDELKMEEIVIAAYTRNCFNLLLWIYENCSAYISTDVRKLLMKACKDGKIEVAKWILQAFDKTLWDINGGELFLYACKKMFKSCYSGRTHGRMHMVNIFYTNFQIKPLDLKSGLFNVLSVLNSEFMRENRDEVSDLVVSLLEKCLDCLSAKDLEEMMKIFLDQKYYVIVNWFLEKENFCSIKKQTILNYACADAELETIKILIKYFLSLDMNRAMMYACISNLNEFFKHEPYKEKRQTVACLDLLLEETDLDSLDISRIVSRVCKQEYVGGKVMSWILQKIPFNRIPINEVLISCCEQERLYHVKYILQEVENIELDINEAFFHACGKRLTGYSSKKYHNVMLVEFLFQRLPDKTASVSALLNEKYYQNCYDLMVFLMRKGYHRDMDIKPLMNQACRAEDIIIVQWILENIQHSKLDIRSSFHEACRNYRMQCASLIWHYIQDINMLDIDSLLKTIKKPSYYSTHDYDGLMNWIKYIQKIHQRSQDK